MGKASPAFQFYPTDFMTGTSRMTTSEVGGYILLLCEQWNTGSVPGDDEKALALIMRCSRGAAKSIWRQVSAKFQRGPDGTWMNARMETERQKQSDYRDVQSQRGKASAEKRWGKGNAGYTPVTPPVTGSVTATPQPDCNSSSSSSKEIKKVPDPPTSIISVAKPPPLVVGPLKFAQKAEKFAFYGSRLRVPHVLHDELRTKLGGVDPHAKLTAWYEQVNVNCEVDGTPILDVFEFLRPQFQAWASGAVMDAELEKFRPKGA
jgi:uncharacterized protein YdaU (DUF1376 family)